MKKIFSQDVSFSFGVKKCICLFALFFVSASILYHGSVEVQSEGVICSPEPTDMTISYGDLVFCTLDTPGDTDIFRFSGIAGESIVILASSTSSVRTCVELIKPDNSRIVACTMWASDRIDTVLDQTGTYSILFKDYYNSATGEYVISLERVIPPSPNARFIHYGETLGDELNPHGDVDLFYFYGTVNDSISIIASSTSAVRTCLELIKPDNSRIVACTMWASDRIDTVLDQTGTYTILFKDYYNSGTGGYTLSMQCLTGPCIILRDNIYICDGHDFTGNGKSDVSVWKPSNGRWYIKGGPWPFWGSSGDVCAHGDYNGDGTTDICVWKPTNGRWYIKGQSWPFWGATGDKPVPADYNGDGYTDVAVWRPANGRWYIKGQSWPLWGASTDFPVPGDYDGDGLAEIAVWRPSNGNWYIRGVGTFHLGQQGDYPVPGDYDGDNMTEIAVWRPSEGKWYVDGLSTQSWGQLGDIPCPGDYNGDGITDIAVFRPSNGRWYIKGQAWPFWGGFGDIPLVR